MVPLWITPIRTPVDEIDSFGLLQVIWVIQRHPDLQTIIGNVQTPSEENLREAGMGVRRRLLE